MKPVLTRQELPRHSIDLATIGLWELPGTISGAMMRHDGAGGGIEDRLWPGRSRS